MGSNTTYLGFWVAKAKYNILKKAAGSIFRNNISAFLMI
jgi:hypothetical protein